MDEMRRALGRLLTNTYYNFQGIRIAFMNQIRDIVRKKNEGIAFDEVEEKKEEKSFDKKYNDSNLLSLVQKLLEDKKITREEYDYFYECFSLIEGMTLAKMPTCPKCGKRSKFELKTGGVKETEEQAKKMLKTYVEAEPIWNIYLSNVKGMGYVLAANLIKSVGYCEKADTVSQLWAFCGYHVVNGKAPKREKGKMLGFNLELKTMVWKISDSLMKGNKGYYRGIYDSEKEKQLNRVYSKGVLNEKYNGYDEDSTQLSKGHAHMRALRKMVKHFLSHYWECSREIVGLPTEKAYVEGVLEHEHVISWKEALEREG